MSVFAVYVNVGAKNNNNNNNPFQRLRWPETRKKPRLSRMAARRRSINLKIRRFSWIGFHLRRGWISGFFFFLLVVVVLLLLLEEEETERETESPKPGRRSARERERERAINFELDLR